MSDLPVIRVAVKERATFITHATAPTSAVKMTIVRELPAIRWKPESNAWVMPTTAGSIMRLNDAMVHLERVAQVQRIAIVPSNPMRPPDSTEPLTFTTPTKPWDHQLRAHHFLAWARAHLGSALLDCGMRTGKTRIVLDHMQSLPPADRRGLVVAPRIVIPVWAEEAVRHAEAGALRVVPLDKGTVAARVAQACDVMTGSRPGIAVVGWSVIERLDKPDRNKLREALAGATIVADEVHYAKGAGSRRSKNLAIVAQGARFRIGASGTPLAHSPLDAYALFRFIDPGVWGTAQQYFLDMYATFGGFNGKQVVSLRNLDDLAKRMSPFTFRVTRDVLKLLPAQHIDVKIELDARTARIYRDVRDEAVAELKSGTLTITNALAKLMRLAQVTSGYLPHATNPDRIEPLHSAKADALRELLESCDSHEPWVVFGRFHHDIDGALMAAHNAGRLGYELSGRKNDLDKWRHACKRGEGAVLCTQIQAGGIGLNLTEAAFCAYMSVGYSLPEFEQSLARIHGSEQTRPVGYYHLLARGTIDIDIRRALKRRADIIEFVRAALVSHQSDVEEDAT